MSKDILLIELREAIGEEGIKHLLSYINKAIKDGIENNLKYNIDKNTMLENKESE